MATNYTKTPYKVQKRGGTEKYGVMAGTFEELKAEGCKHLGLQSYEIETTLEDNTIVDTGYFQSLKPDTLLIFKSKYSEDKVKSLGESLEACSIERKPNIKAENLDADEDNYKDRREDDEKWFEGVDENYQTKSQYMRFKAKSRTSTNFNEIKRKLLLNNSNNDQQMRNRKKEVINNFEKKLEKNSRYDKRFDRYDKGNQKLCNHDGTFKCQGAYNEDSCPHSHHHINPYLRNDYLREFSSWNLEHQIQIKEVLPQLKKAVEDPDSREVNWAYFYELLFTMTNLKLVHRACHHPEDHKWKVDEKQVFLPKPSMIP